MKLLLFFILALFPEGFFPADVWKNIVTINMSEVKKKYTIIIWHPCSTMLNGFMRFMVFAEFHLVISQLI